MDAACPTNLCPVCGRDNACARAADSERPCWCEAVKIDAAALARVPAAARGRACLCRDCAAFSGKAAPSAPRCDDPAGP